MESQAAIRVKVDFDTAEPERKLTLLLTALKAAENRVERLEQRVATLNKHLARHETTRGTRPPK